MAKRKAGVNDIIFELDNDDIEISSEDEAKGNNLKHSETNTSSVSSLNETIIDLNTDDVILVNSSVEEPYNIESDSNYQIGGKTSPDVMVIEDDKNTITNDELDCTNAISVDITSKNNTDGPETIILNEDIAIDSPASNNDTKGGGCESKIPLITVHFKTNRLAKLYKEKIKFLIIDLLKTDEGEDDDTESEISLDLEVWSEDVNGIKPKLTDLSDSLFFVDTDPNEDGKNCIPKYTHGSAVISNVEQEELGPSPTFRRGPVCFNCDGDHYLRDCQLPRNNIRIAEKRKIVTNRQGRYHVEDDQKYGHLIPGRISNQLRHALGLKRHELPLHIYRMRMLGYPPGWLEEARISHSGISMFDSAGNPILDADEVEGQITEAGSKDKFDIKKILDFPGFNVPASLRYKEEGNLLGMPPMSEQDSKLLMLQTLAPNAMKAYKRKKLTFFPSSTPDNSQNCQAEMELDSGDEIADFPSVPPLPDEAPPPMPPPPPPPPQSIPPSQSSPSIDLSSNNDNVGQGMEELSQDVQSTSDKQKYNKISDFNVPDISGPEDDLIVIGECFEKISEFESGRGSPTLDDLEERKRLLLNALEKGTPLKVNSEISITETKDRVDEECAHIEDNEKIKLVEDDKESRVVSTSEVIPSSLVEQVSTDKIVSESPSSDSDAPKIKTGLVKTTLYGTPVLNIASPYVKLPSDDKFAKDICDVINFENLPNSTGNYKKICSLLKKVKSEVDRIQES